METCVIGVCTSESADTKDSQLFSGLMDHLLTKKNRKKQLQFAIIYGMREI